MSGSTYCVYEVGLYSAGEDAYIIDDGKYHAPGTRKVIIFRSGVTNTGLSEGPISGNLFFEPLRALVDKGFTIYAINAGGPTSWGNPNSVAMVAAAKTRIKALFGVTKVAYYAMSMGGLVMLNAIKSDHSDVIGFGALSPACDLDWFHGTAGYTPAYTHPGATSFGGFTASMEAAFGTNTAGWAAATAGKKVYDEPATWRGLMPMKFWEGDADVTVPFGQVQSFVTNVADAQVTLRTLSGSPHVPYLPSVGGPPMQEYVDFFKSLAWP